MFNCTYPICLCVLCALARNYMFLSLAKAPRPQRTSMLILFLSQTPLRALRLCEIILVFFSRGGAEAAEKFNVCFVLTPNTSACSAPWRELICFFLSQRRQGRQERRCLICSYPTPSACSASLREFIYFFLSQRRRGRRELRCLFDS